MYSGRGSSRVARKRPAATATCWKYMMLIVNVRQNWMAIPVTF